MVGNLLSLVDPEKFKDGARAMPDLLLERLCAMDLSDVWLSARSASSILLCFVHLPPRCPRTQSGHQSRHSNLSESLRRCNLRCQPRRRSRRVSDRFAWKRRVAGASPASKHGGDLLRPCRCSVRACRATKETSRPRQFSVSWPINELLEADELALCCMESFRNTWTGRTLRETAHDLNKERVLPPRGRAWNASTINGNRERDSGILQNEPPTGSATEWPWRRSLVTSNVPQTPEERSPLPRPQYDQHCAAV